MSRAEAGRRGDDVRSDLLVEVACSNGAASGVEVSVKSKVAPYYGDSIAAQARTVAAELGVSGASVSIDDRGALPFIIDARLETAYRRAGLPGRARRVAAVDRPPGPKDRLRRSRLYLPGNEPKYMLNAGLYGPDAIILDLEDSVHASEKDAARLLVRNALGALDFGRAERMVRINPFPLGAEDIAAIAGAAPDLLLIPKTESADGVRAVVQELSRHTPRTVWLMPIVETALGVEKAFEIARASDRVVGLTIGLEDLTADLGVPRSAEGAETLYARTRLVNAARAAGVAAIDSVFSDVGDLGALGDWCRRSRGLGFTGCGCLHPRQVPVVHRAYAPSQAEIERAQAIVAAYREAERAGLGVVSLGSKMIDPPVVQRALRLVEVAKEMGLVP